MSFRELSYRWSQGRMRMRAQVARRVPTAITLYPFEILAVLVAALMSIPALLGLSTSAALVGLVGVPAFYIWAALLSFGSVLAAYGMRKHLNDPLASGLTLIGGGSFVYALALFAVSGWGGALAGVTFTVLGGMSLLRSLHFRRLIDIQRGASRLSGGNPR